MATSGKACPEPPAFKLQIMVRVPHDSVPPLVEAATETWKTCSCACREGNRIYFGTTQADEESAFVLFSEAFCSDKQHLDHAEGLQGTKLVIKVCCLWCHPHYGNQDWKPCFLQRRCQRR